MQRKKLTYHWMSLHSLNELTFTEWAHTYHWMSLHITEWAYISLNELTYHWMSLHSLNELTFTEWAYISLNELTFTEWAYISLNELTFTEWAHTSLNELTYHWMSLHITEWAYISLNDLTYHWMSLHSLNELTFTEWAYISLTAYISLNELAHITECTEWAYISLNELTYHWMSLHIIVAVSFALPASFASAFSMATFFTGTNVGPSNVICRASTTEIISGLSETQHMFCQSAALYFIHHNQWPNYEFCRPPFSGKKQDAFSPSPQTCLRPKRPTLVMPLPWLIKTLCLLWLLNPTWLNSPGTWRPPRWPPTSYMLLGHNTCHLQ